MLSKYLIKLPTLPLWLKRTWKVLDYVARLAFLLLAAYAIVFSIGVTWGAYQVYEYGRNLLTEVQDLETNNPKMTRYMQALQDSSPKMVIKQTFIPLDSISPYLRKAVIAAEDAGFYYHPGFDVRAIAEALEANQQRGKTVFGGSTITQQMAKNLFLSSERSWERKFKELAYSVLMEKYLGKDRILELYLNYAQWGKVMFGCEEAAKLYYKKSCAKLSMDQSINLAAVLASPGKHRPDMMHSGFMAKRRAVIIGNIWGQDSLHRKNEQDSLQAVTDSLTDAQSSESQPTESAYPVEP